MFTKFPYHGGGGKPKSQWRSKVKYCPTCGGVITDLPKSIFQKRTYCSYRCGVSARAGGVSHTNNLKQKVVTLVFSVLCSMWGEPETQEEMFKYGIVAVGVVMDFNPKEPYEVS